MSVKKRFIAGAVCPECSRVDTIYIVKDAANQSRHCVECGFAEDKIFPEGGADPPPEPVGQWQPIRLSGDPPHKN